MNRRTATIGHCVLEIDTLATAVGEIKTGGAVYVTVKNQYTGEHPIIENLTNNLVVNCEAGGNLVEIPLSKDLCLGLAQMFLQVARSPEHWPEGAR